MYGRRRCAYRSRRGWWDCKARAKCDCLAAVVVVLVLVLVLLIYRAPDWWWRRLVNALASLRTWQNDIYSFLRTPPTVSGVASTRVCPSPGWRLQTWSRLSPAASARTPSTESSCTVLGRPPSTTDKHRTRFAPLSPEPNRVGTGSWVTGHRVNFAGSGQVSMSDPEFDPVWGSTVVFLVALFAAKERKGKKKYLYSAIYSACIVSKRSDMDHTVLPANTPCLPFLRKRSPDGATPNLR